MKKNEATIRIAGEAGQGLKTMGLALNKIAKDAGLNIFANQDYMSRIRGGNNFYQLRLADKPVYALREKADIIVCLDKASVDIHAEALNSDGIMILDKKEFKIDDNDKAYFDINMYELAKEIGGSDIYISSVALGLVGYIVDIDIGIIKKGLKAYFAGKSDELIDKNIKAVEAGYDFGKNRYKKEKYKIAAQDLNEQIVLNGNEAIGLGAIAAGCKFFSAYPMTPSTSIMNLIAHYCDEFNILVEQAEDELAAINMVIGASYAGVRSMTATSGGGFALMCEGLSLAAMTETPVVIADAQRPAPATGFPTRTEQADLDFLIFGGHGEFARIVYAPGSIEEAFYLTQKAFNLAEKYQIPVIIMTDQHLADLDRNIEKFDLCRIKPERHIVHNNQIYGLTKGQASPTTDYGYTTKVQVHGVILEPFKALYIALGLGAGFIARGYSQDSDHLAGLIEAGINHKGISLIEVLQPCVSFNRKNTYQWYKERIYKLTEDKSYNFHDKDQALAKTLEWGDKIPLGIIYQSKVDSFEKRSGLDKRPPLVDEQLNIKEILNEFV